MKPIITPWGVRVGTKIEMEHTKSPVIAKKIAMTHLHEFGDLYYKNLIPMEARLKRQLRGRR